MGVEYPKGYAYVFSCSSLIAAGAHYVGASNPTAGDCGSPDWGYDGCKNSNVWWGGYPHFGYTCYGGHTYGTSCPDQHNAVPAVTGYGYGFVGYSGCSNGTNQYAVTIYSCGPVADSPPQNATPDWCSPAGDNRKYISLNFAAADAIYGGGHAHLHALGRVWGHFSV
jgi:hypothetical protein